jgi:hypothetical protein
MSDQCLEHWEKSKLIKWVAVLCIFFIFLKLILFLLMHHSVPTYEVHYDVLIHVYIG